MLLRIAVVAGRQLATAPGHRRHITTRHPKTKVDALHSPPNTPEAAAGSTSGREVAISSAGLW